MINPIDIGERGKAFRERGVSAALVWQWKNDTCRPSAKHLTLFAEVMGLSLEEAIAYCEGAAMGSRMMRRKRGEH